VVVIKRHNVRLYLSASGEMSNTGNCLPGTVVDSGITHPYNFDFFLISHEGLQGTVRPTHYVVLQNEMGFNATEISRLDA
jgi:eukaryotic translation initiation factor 2C